MQPIYPVRGLNALRRTPPPLVIQLSPGEHDGLMRYMRDLPERLTRAQAARLLLLTALRQAQEAGAGAASP